MTAWVKGGARELPIDAPEGNAMSDTPTPDNTDIAVAENSDRVDDNAENDETASVTYGISSYGADYTVDGIVKRIRKGEFYIPSFQSSYVWSLPQVSRFIESLLLGLPVPGVFLAKEENTNKHLVIDGKQRLKSLQFFFEGVFREKILSS